MAYLGEVDLAAMPASGYGNTVHVCFGQPSNYLGNKILQGPCF